MKRLSLLFLMLPLVFGVYSQSQDMVLLDVLDNESKMSVNDIQKLTYPPDSLKIHFKDGSVQVLHLDVINQITYDAPLVTVLDISAVTRVSIAPNPFDTYLNISLESKRSSTVQLQIVDLQGVVVKNICFISQIGQNAMIIDLAEINKGIYICCFSTADERQTQLILKL